MITFSAYLRKCHALGLQGYACEAEYEYPDFDGTFWRYEAGVVINGEPLRLNGDGYMRSDRLGGALEDALDELESVQKAAKRSALHGLLVQRQESSKAPDDE